MTPVSIISFLFYSLFSSGRVVPRAGEVLVPAAADVRCPVLLLIGGGMGAGKSTVVKEIMGR